MSLRETLAAAWKFCLSFRKNDRQLSDDPVVIREQKSRLDSAYVSPRFVQRRLGKRLPPLGKEVRFECASSERVDAHPELQDDFIERVLEIDWALVTDESRLSDFHSDETNDALYAKVKEVYGVDISDIKSGNLAEILERIAAKLE